MIMCKRPILNCLLMVAIVTTGVSVSFLYYSKEKKQAVQKYSGINIFTNIIIDNISKQLINDDKTINNVICFSEDGNAYDFEIILDRTPKLILYGGSTYCNSCIDYHLSQVNSLGRTTNGNIVLLFKHITQREMVLIKASHNLNIPVFTTNDDLGLPVETDDTPCFFVAKPDMSVINTFYPVKEKPNYNAIYYNYLFVNKGKFGW